MNPSDKPGLFWDQKFSTPEYLYGREPNEFIAASLKEYLQPGDALLSVGDGEGRNGVYGALEGFKTTSIEPSAVGCKKIRELAKEKGVEIEVIQDQMPSSQIEPESFKAIILTFIHAPPETRRLIHQSCIDALQPGGYLFLEGFRPEQRILNRKSGGPGDLTMLFTTEILEADFGTLEILHLEELTRPLNEGPGHQGAAEVIQLIARKK